MNWEFVRSDTLRNVHGRLIERYGGLPGVRDVNALESAIARPANLEAHGGPQTAATLAAALPWAILRNHPFTDGNKRAALAALVMFADLNQLQLFATEVEETAMVLQAAAGELTEEASIAWVEGIAVERIAVERIAVATP